jgi:preprotein translocase subunit SecE
MNKINLLGLVSKLIRFLKEVKLEIKKVNWPTRENVIRYTLIIIVSSLIIAAFLGGLDVVFTSILNKFVL